MRDVRVTARYGEEFSLPFPDREQFKPWPKAHSHMEMSATLDNGEDYRDVGTELRDFCRAMVKTDRAHQQAGHDDLPVEVTVDSVVAEEKEMDTAAPDHIVWFNWGKPVSLKDRRVSELSIDELNNLMKSKFYGKGNPGDPTFDKGDTSCGALFKAVDYWLGVHQQEEGGK